MIVTHDDLPVLTLGLGPRSSVLSALTVSSPLRSQEPFESPDIAWEVPANEFLCAKQALYPSL